MKSEQLHLGGRWEMELWAPVVLLLPASSAVAVEPALEAPNICFCRCCCYHINSHNQVRVYRAGSSHSGSEEYPQGQSTTTKGGTRIYHSRRNSCLRQKHKEVKAVASLRCARSILVHTFHHSRRRKPNIPLATQERLPRIYYT